MKNTQKLTIAALLLSIGQVLPFVTAQIPSIGALLAPMHLPVLLGGFILGPVYGLLLGIVTPILRHMVFTMPPFPGFIFMAFELGTYGLMSGLLFQKVFKNSYSLLNIYISLIISMVLGRLMYGLVKFIFVKYVMRAGAYTFALLISDTVTGSIPGIILQLLIIPFLVLTLRKRKSI